MAFSTKASSRAVLLALGAAIALLAALLPNTARASDDCLVRPNSAAPSEQHWYYRIDREKNQRCWFLGGKKQSARNDALLRSANVTTLAQTSERPVATTCRNAPAGIAPAGKRWTYMTDKSTGQKCWRLGARSLKREPVKEAQSRSAVSASLFDKLPLPVARAQARFEKPGKALVQVADATPTESAVPAELSTPKAEVSVPKEVTYEELLESTFGSRWDKTAETFRSSNAQASLVGEVNVEQSPPASAEASFAGHRPAPRGESSGDILAYLVVAAGSAFLFLGLFGKLLHFSGASRSPDHYPPPFRVTGLEGINAKESIEDILRREASDRAERDRYRRIRPLPDRRNGSRSNASNLFPNLTSTERTASRFEAAF
jgi:hypothetical protein